MPQAARFFDAVFSAADVHGPPWWPMVFAVQGLFLEGSPNVTTNSLPAVRLGDGGPHVACAGPNRFAASSGHAKVTINSKPAVSDQSTTLHCGRSSGKVVAGLCSPNTTVESITS